LLLQAMAFHYSITTIKPYTFTQRLAERVAVRASSPAAMRAVLLTVALAMCSSCATVIAAQTEIDCTLPHTDTRIQACSIVKRASDFNGCLQASDITKHTCVIMDSDVAFCDAQQSINFTAMFDRSNKTLDCKGGVIDHGWSDKSAQGITPTSRAKQMPFVRFNDDRSLSDISVKNCTMRGTFHAGIQMTRFFGGELGGDGKLDETEDLPVGHNDILFEDINIEGTQVGIYLGNFSENIEMNRVHIDGTERIAVYSEAGSNNIRLTNSTISNNRTREAIAIDSTYNSEISNTRFLNNREGAINVYQNCGELKGSVCPVVRSTPSNGNRITGNTFINNGITGIQIASRQGRNHAFGWCATLNGLPGQFTDESINNVVEDNTIHCSEGTALVLMDGPNLVQNNTIVAKEHCVPIEISTGGFGKSKSHLLDGLEVQGNTINSIRPPRLRNVSDKVTFEQ